VKASVICCAIHSAVGCLVTLIRQVAPSQPDNHQNIELNEADGWNHEQIHRGDVWRMVAQEPRHFVLGCCELHSQNQAQL
jgi:hypothetical protein